MSVNNNLHPIEISLLRGLSSGRQMSIKELVNITGLEVDQIRRGIEWLKFKNMIQITDKITHVTSLGPSGKIASTKRTP